MKSLIIGWLAAKGVPLANDATDQTVIDALQSVFKKSENTAAALGNEKNSVESKITALENDAATANKKAADAATALANEQTAHTASKKAAAGVVVDEAIRLGIKTVADRDAAVTSLANSADFAKDADALLKTKPVHKTDRSGLDMSGKQQAALSNEAQALQNEYNAAFQTELQATGQNPVAAHRNIMTLPKYTGLAAKLVPSKTPTAH